MGFKPRKDDKSKLIYHGSDKLYTLLEPQYSDLLKTNALYGSPLEAAALCFAANWGDKDIALGTMDGSLYIEELTLNAFSLLKVKGWLYSLPSTNFKKDLRLCDFELYSQSPVTPIKITRFENIFKELQRHDIRIISKS